MDGQKVTGVTFRKIYFFEDFTTNPYFGSVIFFTESANIAGILINFSFSILKVKKLYFIFLLIFIISLQNLHSLFKEEETII